MSPSMACPLCKQHAVAYLFTKAGRRFYRCSSCRLEFVHPQPTGRELDRMYNENYFASAGKRMEDSLGYYDYLAEKPLLLPYFRRKLRFAPGRTILEIGSGYGFFLEEAQRAGKDILGIDISRPAVAYAKKQNLHAKAVDLLAAKFSPQSFDSVVAFHLIEHVPDPVAFIREVARITKPGGTLLLATPRAQGYLHRIMGKRWFSYRHREHLFFFSATAMTLLLTKAGYTDIRCFGDETRWYPIGLLLRGARYYFSNPWWQTIIQPFSGVSVPFPMDTMLVTATKGKR